MGEKKMTNIRLDPALWARVKAAAGERGTTLERWVTEALQVHLRAQGDGAPRVGDPGPAPAATPGEPGSGQSEQGELRDLHWRVEALEAAVDYLAGVVGAGFPRDPHRPGQGKGSPGAARESP